MYLKVNTKEELVFLVQDIEKMTLSWIAIDTEFFRETTYFPVLSLIQIASQTKVWIIDAITCKDLTPLKSLLENKKIKKIFHAGDQDWAILKQVTGAATWPFNDTQIMAAFAKLGHSNSLESLVAKLLDLPLDKSQQKTDWLQRPLSLSQLEYASQDAAYVAKIYPLLDKMLTELERDSWVCEEMELLLEKYQNPNFSKDWLKLCSTGCTWPVPFYAMQLAKWREEWAKKLDLPKRHVLADALLEAVIKENNLEGITQKHCLPEVYDDLVSLWGRLKDEHINHRENEQEIMEMVKNYHQEFSVAKRKSFKKWQLKAKAIAKTLDIPAYLVLNKQQLLQLVTEKTTLSGWRKEFLKQKIPKEMPEELEV